ncbi:MAG: secondary thiamine-phosphate synthase enzyme YjbQ [Thermosphaera sp.]
MKVFIKRLTVQTRKDKELVDITENVEEVVKESGIKDGLVLVVTMHTSSGIIVTEGLSCLEKDILNHLARLVPADGDYYHNRFLDIDGRLGFNADAHLKSVLGGIHAVFPIQNGEIIKGARQRIYFAEYDGPLSREYCVQVIGE